MRIVEYQGQSNFLTVSKEEVFQGGMLIKAAMLQNNAYKNTKIFSRNK